MAVIQQVINILDSIKLLFVFSKRPSVRYDARYVSSHSLPFWLIVLLLLLLLLRRGATNHSQLPHLDEEKRLSVKAILTPQ